MNKRVKGSLILVFMLVLGLFAPSGFALATDDVSLGEEQAIQAAVDGVAPSVVRIETVGGLERVERVLVGTGPTTGLIVSTDGYIISSAFNFAQKPASILVTLPGGNRVAAELVSTDHSRRLVLLKVSSAQALPVPDFVPQGEMHPGQWAIAVGRTFDGEEPNVSVGIVSATDRIWSKAIQTDAKISPSNYGGPLVDISGRVLGVLAPLAPDGNSDTAGVEWYDSGIGFAVPLEHIQQVLPRLKGNDLYPGVVGISFASSDIFGAPAKLAAVRPNSPAAKVGLKADDVIVEAAGRKIARQAQLKHQLGPRYAGDKIALVVERGKDRIPFEVELAEKLLPYERPVIGALPMRPVDGTAEPAGVALREVFENSPAAMAGLARGDRIESIDGVAVRDVAALNERLREKMPGDKVSIHLRRGDEQLDREVTLAAESGYNSDSAPPAHTEIADRDAAVAATGIVQLKAPEFPNECIAYVPENYSPKLTYGVVVWIHPAGGYKQEELVDRWKAHCSERDLILLAPRSADAAKWHPTEVKVIRRMLDELQKTHKVDPLRIVVHGQKAGGAMAMLVALTGRDVVRGAAVLEAGLPPMAPSPETDPVNRLALYFAAANLNAPAIKSTIDKLRELKHPVEAVELGADRSLNDQELEGLVDWIDSLDRI